MRKILQYLENYGFGGLIIYLKLISCKHGLIKKAKIKVPKIKKPILVRNSTSDYPIFNQVFRDLEYDINFGFEPKSIIDAGANIGLTALYFSGEYPNCKIISIEPESLNFEVLVENTKANANIIPVKKALSNKLEKLSVMGSDRETSSFTTEKLESNEDDKGRRNEVETTTVSELMRENDLKSVDVVKIDIEGFEKELFESNHEDWVPYTKVLIIELHDRMKKGCSKSLFECMVKYDFELDMRGENLIFTNLNKPLQK
ncbi:FkbM family methyltransferase [Reichenbachiella sp.]|uniref:FkbM family methyltransferase n=1 Tax=Reichenbachiella sp. TaxID=2184521 RepID=UPI003BB0DCF2